MRRVILAALFAVVAAGCGDEPKATLATGQYTLPGAGAEGEGGTGGKKAKPKNETADEG